MLPKPGAWMNWFRKAMAVPMGLTALALLWLASRVGGDKFLLTLIPLAGFLQLTLSAIGKRQRLGLALRPTMWAALALIVALAALSANQVERNAPTSRPADSILPIKPFSETALAAARASGKPVFLYFTADWCLTCKVNEAAAIEREDTRAAFEIGRAHV